jgi:hypothetical protein
MPGRATRATGRRTVHCRPSSSREVYESEGEKVDGGGGGGGGGQGRGGGTATSPAAPPRTRAGGAGGVDVWRLEGSRRRKARRRSMGVRRPAEVEGREEDDEAAGRMRGGGGVPFPLD